jgi:flagellar hook-basal body complex protein FliE
VDFKEVFTKALDQVNAKQVEADQLTRDFIAGEVDDLHTVMIATEEARLSLELAVQVRNKCIEAYKEISNMQL